MPKQIVKGTTQKQTHSVTHAVREHTRTKRRTMNSKAAFKKMTGLRGKKYDEELNRQLDMFPVDWIINHHKWYHLDKVRNKLYHQ